MSGFQPDPRIDALLAEAGLKKLFESFFSVSRVREPCDTLGVELPEQCAAAGVPFFMKQMVDHDGTITGLIERFPGILQRREFPQIGGAA